MSLTQYYTATTLDGFLADADNSLDWLFTRKREPDGKDPADWRWPYEIPCWVFTHREPAVVPGAPIEFTSDDVGAVHGRMVDAADGRSVWIVGGGDLAGQFADAGLLDPFLLPDDGDEGDFACARYSVPRPTAP